MEENNTNLPDNQAMDINADADVPGNTHFDDDTKSEAQEKILQELDEQKDKYLRLFAEFENFKRRSRTERDEFSKIANRDIVVAMLEVLDDADRAETQINTSNDVAQIKEGISLVFSKLRNKLQQKGVKEMEATNTDFDVEKHEAIAELPADDDKIGKVIDVAQKGYYLHDKIVRFAKVVVGK
jgi:molecular chaperone GrpE